MAYSLPFWLQMSEQITHMDTDKLPVSMSVIGSLICNQNDYYLGVIICVQVCNWFTHLQLTNTCRYI